MQTRESPCTIRKLPERLLKRASQVAIKINPANAPVVGAMGSSASLMTPQFLTIFTSKYWGASQRVLTVSFIPPNSPFDLKTRILSHMNAWQIGISFALASAIGQIRIAFGPTGY